MDTSLERVPAARLDALLVEHRYPRLEALLADIALGNRMPQQVAIALVRERGDGARRRGEEVRGPSVEAIQITGTEKGVISFANCCLPVPGDEIMGYHTAGKGIVVHRLDCPNVAEYRKSPERWVPIGWDRAVQGDFHAALKIEVDNRPGALAQIAAAIAEAKANIDRVEYLERDANVAVLRFGIEVTDRSHLADVMRKVRKLTVALGVQRI
jgi:guanosine-3',5'-bis(diphosphate) 3'-pyrophosphohydrolase